MVRIAALIAVVGCSHPPTPTPLGAPDAAPAFAAGLQALEHPDRSGAVDYDSAYEAFARAVELGGGPHASFNAGWVAQRLGRLDLAERHLRDAAEADPGYERATSALAHLLMARGRADEAAELLKARIVLDPTSELRIELLDALVASGRYDEARTHAEETLQQDPEQADVYLRLSELYDATGHVGLRDLAVERARSLGADGADLHHDLALRALAGGDRAAAAGHLLDALERDPDHVGARGSLGALALSVGDFARAVESFAQVVALMPGDVDARVGLAAALAGQGDRRGASKQYATALELAPERDEIRLRAAALFEEDGKLGRAVALLEGGGPGTAAALERVRGLQAQGAAAETAALAAEAQRRAWLAELPTVLAELRGLAETCPDAGSVIDALDQLDQVVEAGAIELADEARVWVEAQRSALADLGCVGSR